MPMAVLGRNREDVFEAERVEIVDQVFFARRCRTC